MKHKFVSIIFFVCAAAFFSTNAKAQVYKNYYPLPSEPRTRVTIENTCFELRPVAYETVNQETLVFIAQIIRAFNQRLSDDNKIKCVYIFDPGELTDDPHAEIDHQIMGIPLEDIMYRSDQPLIQREWLLQMFTHESCHYVADEKLAAVNRPRSEWTKYGWYVHEIYKQIAGLKSFSLTKNADQEFYALFTESKYDIFENSRAGHPWASTDELFASACTISILYEDEFLKRAEKSSPAVKDLAFRLFLMMQEFSISIPKRQELPR